MIGASLKVAVREAIQAISESHWRPYQDGHNAFRLIVVRRRVQNPLPGIEGEEASPDLRYQVLATDHKKIPEWVGDWYRQRGEASENRIKEMKIGFGMERMPSGDTKANGFFPDRSSGLQPLSPVPGSGAG